MEVAAARTFVERNHRAVLATRRSGGGTQMSPVMAGGGAEGRVIISSTEPTAKGRNLRRDHRASPCVLTARFFRGGAATPGNAHVRSPPGARRLLVGPQRHGGP